MSKEKTYLKCKYFNTIKCPERDKGLMKQFIQDTTIPELTIPTDLTSGFNMTDEINELCFNCYIFKVK